MGDYVCNIEGLAVGVLGNSEEGFPVGDPTLLLKPYRYFDRMSDDVRLAVHEVLEDAFFSIPEGNARVHRRIERLSRLADGEYDVAVPRSVVPGAYSDVQVPATKITVIHKRTHHPGAKYNHGIALATHDSSTRIAASGSVPGALEELVNVQFHGRDICSTYSTLQADIALPEGWDEAQTAFTETYLHVVEPHMRAVGETIRAAVSEGRDLDQLRRRILEHDKDVLTRDQRKMIMRASRLSTVLHTQISQALQILASLYGDLVNGRPFVPVYRKKATFFMDHHHRLLDMGDISYGRPIHQADLDTGYAVEQMPYNDAFHDMLRQTLQKRWKSPQYMIKAIAVMNEAYSLLDDGHYASATERAQTAFEIALRGFVGSKQVVSESRLKEAKLDDLLRHLFDMATVQDGTSQGRSVDLFDQVLVDKILGGSPDTRGYAFREIRNVEAHQGGTDRVHAGDARVARYACAVYSDALRYIYNKGWSQTDWYRCSDVDELSLAYMNGHLRTRTRENTLADVGRIVPRALQFLDPTELSWRMAQIPPNSWAYKQLEEALRGQDGR